MQTGPLCVFPAALKLCTASNCNLHCLQWRRDFCLEVSDRVGVMWVIRMLKRNPIGSIDGHPVGPASSNFSIYVGCALSDAARHMSQSRTTRIAGTTQNLGNNRSPRSKSRGHSVTSRLRPCSNFSLKGGKSHLVRGAVGSSITSGIQRQFGGNQRSHPRGASW